MHVEPNIAGCKASAYEQLVCNLQVSMLVSGIAFGIGVILMAAAQEIGMLIVGRIFLGVGVGFAIQVCEQYIAYTSSELQTCNLPLLIGQLSASTFSRSSRVTAQV